MKTVLLILSLAVSVSAQRLDGTEWKLIKEMSGVLKPYNNLPLSTYGAKVARSGDKIKISLRFDFPKGAPFELFKDSVEKGFDVSSIERVVGRVELNCKTMVVKTAGGSAELYQFNGTRHKTKEPPFKIKDGNLLASYFCERPAPAPTVNPTLKSPTP